MKMWVVFWMMGAALALSACGGEDAKSTAMDAGMDADTAGDAASDGGSDAVVDTIADAAADGGGDGTGDAGEDVSADAGVDVAQDSDTTEDADTTQDAGADGDAGLDATDSSDGLDSADSDGPDDTVDAADAADSGPPDGWTPGTMCSPMNGMCPSGQFCYEIPCPKCGAKPMGQCMPDLPLGGCYDYTACGADVCVGSDIGMGKAGTCKTKPAAGQCWGQASSPVPACLPGSTCDATSLAATGTCKADASQAGKVYLWVRNGTMISPGETTTVTWVNYTNESIFLGGCGTYSIYSSKDGTTWKDLGPGITCVWEGIAVEVKPGQYVDTNPWTAPGSMDGSNYKLIGDWATGCTAGKPLSQAGCKATNQATTAVMFVGLAP